MAETSVPGAGHRRSSGDRPNRAGGNPPPPSPLSSLPDAVIHRIFSFLPLRDVVRTSVLSEQWRYTWTAVTDLVSFDAGEIEDRAGTGSTLGFSSIVDSVLSQCTSPTVNFLHCLSCLVRLEIGGSPVLESLELRRCLGVENIIMESTSAKDLVLKNPESYQTVKIWAPHLLSLRISADLDHFAVFRLDDISSLVEAEVVVEFVSYFDPGVVDYNRTLRDSFKELLEKLCGVPAIAIDGQCLQILSLLEMEGVTFPSSKCQNLILHGSVGNWDLPGIAYMLRSSHCLEKLVIHLTERPELKFELDEESKERFNFDEEDFLCSRKGNFECLAKHLKRVEIIGFEADSFGSKPLLALIKFILGYALVLEKLIIKAKLPTRRVQKRLQAAVLLKLLGVSKNVLSCPRASKKAEVIFNYPFE